MGSTWLMVDPWEASQSFYLRTAPVLDHFHECLNGKDQGGIALPDGRRKRIRIMLLAGGDLIQSFALPNVWAEKDVSPGFRLAHASVESIMNLDPLVYS